MKDFGLCLLGRSLADVVFSEYMLPYNHAMGLVRCAHAAEIIIKARIAEEHPLLIFSKLPEPGSDSLLDVETLLTDGKTLLYSELPAALWAAIGYRLSNTDHFVRFGRLRNSITHFAVPDIDLDEATIRFTFEVMEPMIYSFWKSDIIGLYEDCMEEEEYLLEQLVRYGIPFNRRGLG